MKLSRVLSTLARLTAKNPGKHSPKIIRIRVYSNQYNRSLFGGREFFEANLNVKDIRLTQCGYYVLPAINHPFETVELKCAREELQRAKKGERFSVRGKINGRVFRGTHAVLTLILNEECTHPIMVCA